MLKIGLYLVLLLAKAPIQKQLQVRQMVTIMFLNNSSRAKEYSFISYAPDEAQNGTVQVKLAPEKTYKASFMVGTKLYLADDKQVAWVMSGRRLPGPPFMVISEKDNDKTVRLTQ